MMSRSPRAFTLIELLVVIAIISILAAILFPVFAQAREKARQTTCLSNIRQLNLSLNEYVQDYDETMPPSLQAVSGPGGAPVPPPGRHPHQPRAGAGVWWTAFDDLYPYMKNAAVIQCPDDPTAFDVAAAPGLIADLTGQEVIGGTNFRYASYVYNLSLFGIGFIILGNFAGQNFLNEPSPATLASVAYPADQVTFYEGFLSSTLDPIAPMSVRHSGFSNWAFVDGHAKAKKCPTNPDPMRYDTFPIPPRYADLYYVDSGPYRTVAPNLRFDVNGLVKDPDCLPPVNPDTCVDRPFHP